jgi:hypothetical protein
VDARDGVAYPAWVDDRETTGTFKVYTSPIQLWGVVQSSVSDSIINEDMLQLTVKAKWSTDSWSDGVDSLVVTSPTGVKYTGTCALSSPTTIHSVTKLCTCEAGDWTYIVKSCRPGFKSRVSTAKTIRIYNCVD